MLSPALANILHNFPAFSAFNSTYTLSVSTIAITSSIYTKSPSFFYNSNTVPSVMLSPILGTLKVLVAKQNLFI
jgi:hypothetical protein